MQTRLKQRSIILLSLLALQFILGMILNLFVTIPDKHPGQVGNYFVRSDHSFVWAISIGGGVTLFLHVLVALGLLINSIVFVLQASKVRNKRWIWFSSIGLIGILAAFSNGLSFLDFNRNLNSFIMASGYILATVSYTAGIFLELQSQQKKVHTS